MALNELHFIFDGKIPEKKLKKWSHTGVVGSGDLEIMTEQRELGGKTEFKVVTPVRGFDKVWERVLETFVSEKETGNLSFEINDNNATPFVAAMRLKQAILEAEAEEGGGDRG